MATAKNDSKIWAKDTSCNANVNLMQENLNQIKYGITLNVDVSV